MPTPMGPNAKKLFIRRLSIIAIPGGGDPLQQGAEFLTNPGSFKTGAAEALAFVRSAIAQVKAAPDNPYGDDDEAIAAALLQMADEREKEQREKTAL